MTPLLFCILVVLGTAFALYWAWWDGDFDG